MFLYDYVSDNKPCNFPLFLVSEQHDYFTRSASAQQLHIPHSRINIRKFCPTVPSTANLFRFVFFVLFFCAVNSPKMFKVYRFVGHPTTISGSGKKNIKKKTTTTTASQHQRQRINDNMHNANQSLTYIKRNSL